MKVSYIIVTYNSSDTIEKCINSILCQESKESFEIIVIDNNSLDDTRPILDNFNTNIHVIKSNENLGFARANNVAAEIAKGEYLILVNPDAFLDKNAGEEMIKVYGEQKNVAVVGGKIENATDDIKPFPSMKSLWNTFFEKLERMKETKDSFEVPWVCGAFFAIPKQLFVEYKGFDSRFFLYYEETDLCKRLRSDGYKIILNPLAIANHEGGGSAKKVETDLGPSDKMIPSFKYLSMMIYLRKHLGLKGLLFYVLLESFFKVIIILKRLNVKSNYQKYKRDFAFKELSLMFKSMYLTKFGLNSPPQPWRKS